MSSIFNPAALTKTAVIPGLFDIMITWNRITAAESITAQINPGDTIITSLTVSDNKLVLDMCAVEPCTKIPHILHKEIAINTNYAMQEYTDANLYILYDYTKLPTSIVNIELEPYVVIFDNDYTADYVGSTTINTGGGLNVFASDSGLTILMDLPLVRVETIETPIAIRCINGIVPTNGDIQIAGVGDTIVTASQFSEG